MQISGDGDTMKYRKIMSQFVFVMIVLFSGSVALWGEEEVIMPVRDFLTLEEAQLLAAPASSSFDFTVKKRLINGPAGYIC